MKTFGQRKVRVSFMEALSWRLFIISIVASLCILVLCCSVSKHMSICSEFCLAPEWVGSIDIVNGDKKRTPQTGGSWGRVMTKHRDNEDAILSMLDEIEHGGGKKEGCVICWVFSVGHWVLWPWFLIQSPPYGQGRVSAVSFYVQKNWRWWG